MFCLNRWLNEYNELTLLNNKLLSKFLESGISRKFYPSNIIVYVMSTLGDIFRTHFYILRLMGFRFYQYFSESSTTSFDYIRNRTTLQSHFTTVLKFTLVAKKKCRLSWRLSWSKSKSISKDFAKKNICMIGKYVIPETLFALYHIDRIWYFLISNMFK